MPQEFTQACQSARQAMQNAWNVLTAAHDVAGNARAEVRAKERQQEQAKTARDDAQQAENTANAAWDAQIMAITSDPTFGVKDLEAGLGEGEAGTAGAGPFGTRAGGSLGLWARSEISERLAEWHTHADRALQENTRLANAAAAATTARTAAEATYSTAQEALADASFALHTALLTVDQAETAHQASRTTVAAACAGQQSSAGDDPEITIAPGVLPEDEQRIKDRLDSLPDAETDGLEEIDMTGEEGHEFTYTDENTDEEVTTTAGGTYGGNDITINDVTGEKAEEIFKHEVGHHVYKKMSDDTRQSWNDWYDDGNNSLKSPTGKMPTGYASRNPDEGFAECYEMFHDAPERLNTETREKIRAILGRLS
jgi:hypothetical protein